jgi:hypothetical protein
MEDNSQTPVETPASDADAEYLIHWLANRDAFCPLCNYNLRALQTPRCPECGEGLRLRVMLAEPYLKAWICLAASSSAGAGLGILCLICITKLGWPRRSEWWLTFPILIAISTIPISMIAVFRRKRLLRLSRSLQWIFALFAMFLVFIALIIFGANVR